VKGSVSKNSKFWRQMVNFLFTSFSGGKNRPRIMSAKGLFPLAEQLEQNFDKVSTEILTLMEKRSFTPYKDIDIHRAKEVSLEWKLYYIKMLREVSEQARQDCPYLAGLTEHLNTVQNVTIAVLDPGVTLAAHEGPYAGILRYHLGIKVPENNPPYIRVGEEFYVWQEGQSTVIDDCFEHEVYNESDGVRVILIIDFMRPMNFVLHQINRFSLHTKRKWGQHIVRLANGKS
jgi:aspartyl/asparaginyl beta-hydroxylase (cupin superfamily)